MITRQEAKEDYYNLANELGQIIHKLKEMNVIPLTDIVTLRKIEELFYFGKVKNEEKERYRQALEEIVKTLDKSSADLFRYNSFTVIKDIAQQALEGGEE